jgi:hypothetical protein
VSTDLVVLALQILGPCLSAAWGVSVMVSKATALANSAQERAVIAHEAANSAHRRIDTILEHAR